MVASGADIGIALDGDADRLIVVDEKGQIVDGDQLMALIALGLQRARRAQGRRRRRHGHVQPRPRAEARRARPQLSRTQVGDRYVLEEMRESGCNVGGEQSGHIILADHATTGDGLVAALQVLAALVEAEGARERAAAPVRAAAAAAQERPLQRRREPLETDSVRKRIAAAEAELEGAAASSSASRAPSR